MIITILHLKEYLYVCHSDCCDTCSYCNPVCIIHSVYLSKEITSTKTNYNCLYTTCYTYAYLDHSILLVNLLRHKKETLHFLSLFKFIYLFFTFCNVSNTLYIGLLIGFTKSPTYSFTTALNPFLNCTTP